MLYARLVAVALFCTMARRDASAAVAGPPYVTDDPVPTDYRTWEMYTGILYDNEGAGSGNSTTPFAEFSDGAMPNV